MSFFENELPFLDIHFLPFFLMVLAILWVMLIIMTKWPYGLALWGVAICLISCWLWGVFLSLDHRFSSQGFLFDAIGIFGLLMMIPALCFIYVINQSRLKMASSSVELLLLSISCLGLMAVLFCGDWLIFFIGIQCATIPLYGLLLHRGSSSEHVLNANRYLLYSLVAFSFMLFGIMLLYAASGTMIFLEQGPILLREWGKKSEIPSLALGLIFFGLGFKASIFPFHMWARDVYLKSPSYLLGYMVVLIKGAVVLFLLRIFIHVFPPMDHALALDVLSIIAILTMWVGNSMMLREQRFLGFLAYLSIGHMGFLLLPMLLVSKFSMEAICFDVAAFGLSILVLLALIKNYDLTRAEMKGLQGLFYSDPIRAITLALTMLSCVGFPLTVGFMGKLLIAMSVAHAHEWNFLIHLMLSNIIGIVAVLGVILSMFFRESSQEADNSHLKDKLALILPLIAILGLGVYPNPAIDWVKKRVETQVHR